MKKLKICIGIIIIIIVIIVLSIVLIDKNKNNNNISEDIHIDSHASEQDETTDVLKNNIEFFTVSSCVSKYLDILNKTNDIYYGYNDLGEYEQRENPYNAVIQILSLNYIKKNNISLDSVENKIKLSEEKYIFTPIKMRVAENETVNKYVVYGIVQNLRNEYIDDIYVFVNLDLSNATFSIEPIEEEYKNIEEIECENNENNIVPNDFNNYVEAKVNDEYIAKKYLEIYKQLALTRPDIAYEFLDEEYKNKRFGDLQSYENYIDNNKQEIQSIQLNKYLVNSYDEYKEYIGIDNNGSYYIFKEIAIMEFTLQLDTYTIPSKKFMDEYSKGNDKNKVLLNVDKWIDMLNNRDYTTAYNVLDETFRDNNFGSEENFEKFIRQLFPLHYKAEYSEYTEQNGTHSIAITLSNIKGEDEEAKKITVIMQLKEGTDFVMSFSVN